MKYHSHEPMPEEHLDAAIAYARRIQKLKLIHQIPQDLRVLLRMLFFYCHRALDQNYAL